MKSFNGQYLSKSLSYDINITSPSWNLFLSIDDFRYFVFWLKTIEIIWVSNDCVVYFYKVLECNVLWEVRLKVYELRNFQYLYPTILWGMGRKVYGCAISYIWIQLFFGLEVNIILMKMSLTDEHWINLIFFI